MSLEPQEMRAFVQAIRDVERAMGNTRRIMSDEEKSNRLNVRRSVVLDQSVEKGQKLGDVKVKFKRPGYGIAPDLYESLLDRTFKDSFDNGYVLGLSDLA